MTHPSLLVYDCETIHPVLSPDETPLLFVSYCDGWEDFEDMGISVITAFDYVTGDYRVFCEDNLNEFQELVDERAIVAGFNNIAFDNRLCRAHGIHIDDSQKL